MYIRVHATPGFEQMCIRLLAPARKGGSDFLAGATVPRLLAVTFQRVQWPASPPIWNSVESPTSCREIPTYLAPSTNFLSSRPPPPSLGKGARGSLSLEEITHLQSRFFAFPRSNVGRRKEKRGRGRARERVLVKRWRGENGGGSLSPVDRDPRRSTRTLALPVVLLRHAAFA